MNDKMLEGLNKIWANAMELQGKKALAFNEANTKAVVIQKVLELLGWHIENGEVSMEFPLKTEKSTISVDYALLLDGKPRIIVECKPLNTRLGEAESIQVMKYAFYGNIPWAILTNGKLWIVSNADYKEEFFRFDLSKPGSSLNKIKLLSRESVRTGVLQKTGEDSYTAQAISRYLDDNKPRFVEEIHSKDTKLNKETISRLLDEMEISFPAPEQPVEVEAEKETKPTILDRLDDNQKAIIDALKSRLSEIGPGIISWAVKNYYAFGINPTGRWRWMFADFHRRRKGLRLYIWYPYKELQNPPEILQLPPSPGAYPEWKEEITIARIYSPEQIDEILPAMRLAYELVVSRHGVRE